MKYLSVCSGIEAATVAWHGLGWTPAAFSEIEPFPSAVLAHHWPDVPNLGDLTQHGNWPTIRPDIIVGGTPCQAFSVAGLRKGLEDPRGNLTLVFLGLLARERPRWVVWENVPGVLSDQTGAFGAFLGGLGELGYGFAYRVLDAQFFGVAQRRRRVFVVGYLGDWRPAAAVLFEPDCLRGDSPPRREAGEGVAGTLKVRAGSGGGPEGPDAACVGHLIPQVAARMVAFGEYECDGTSSTMKMRDYKDATDLVAYGIPGNWIGRKPENGGNAVEPMNNLAPCLTKTDKHAVAHTLRGEGFDASEDGTGRGTPLVPVYSVCMGSDPIHAEDLAQPITRRNGDPGTIATSTAVRRLTPTECERLQGFPDGHTLIPWRNRVRTECPDGPRYKALGNSMAVPVMRWIGERIASINSLIP